MTEDNREPNTEEPARPEAPTDEGQPGTQAAPADQPPSAGQSTFADRQPAPDTVSYGDQPPAGAGGGAPQGGQAPLGASPYGDRAPGDAGGPMPPAGSFGDRAATDASSTPGGSFGDRAAGEAAGPASSAGSYGDRAADPGSPTSSGGSFGDRAPGEAFGSAPPAGSYGDRAADAGSPTSSGGSFGDRAPGEAFGSTPPAGSYGDRAPGEATGPASPAGSYGDRAAADAGSPTPSAGTSVPSGAGPAQPAPAFAGSGDDTPPRGFPAPSERVLFGTAFNQGGGLGTPPRSGTYPTLSPQSAGPGQPPPPEQRKGRGGLVAGLTVLALLVGGGAGAVGGYVVAENNAPSAPVENALDRPAPTEQTSAAPTGSVEAVAEKVLPSVVQLQVRGRSAAGEGSGFVISSDGLIVTNNHVVEAAADSGEIVAVFHDGSTASAEIVGRDPTSDVAVVRADKTGLQVVELGRSDDLRVGQGVVAFGSPFELSGTVTSGIVSALHRPTRAGGEDGSQATVMDAIQTDAAINPGNSGGPLVNMQGQVVGINSAIYSPTQTGSVGIGFAIPIDQARRTADEIVRTGKATQTILGVTVRDDDEGGALIVEVTPNGPGAKAGLRQGDVVTKLDERRIDTSDALVAAVRSHKPGDKVRLELGNGSRTVEATLAGQPVETE